MKRGSRRLLLLLMAGVALGGQVPAVLPPPKPKPQSVVPAVAADGPTVQKAQDPKLQALTGMPRLKVLVEAAENAIKVEGKEDWDTASERSDEAEILTADWMMRP